MSLKDIKLIIGLANGSGHDVSKAADAVRTLEQAAADLDDWYSTHPNHRTDAQIEASQKAFDLMAQIAKERGPKKPLDATDLSIWQVTAQLKLTLDRQGNAQTLLLRDPTGKLLAEGAPRRSGSICWTPSESRAPTLPRVNTPRPRSRAASSTRALTYLKKGVLSAHPRC